MDLDWTQESTAGVTLVRARLHSERATDRRVRLRNRLDGPVLPPRREGVPEAGWDRDGLTTVVPAGGTAAVGYACPAPESTPPLAVESVGPVGERSPDGAAAAVRDLGDHRPPRAVLGGGHGSGDGTAPASVADDGVDGVIDGAAAGTGDGEASPSPPDGAAELLAGYRRRIRTAEALGGAGVVEATALLGTNGGLAGVESLGDELDRDAAELRALARVAETLAARAAAAAPPTEALRGLS